MERVERARDVRASFSSLRDWLRWVRNSLVSSLRVWVGAERSWAGFVELAAGWVLWAPGVTTTTPTWPLAPSRPRLPSKCRLRRLISLSRFRISLAHWLLICETESFSLAISSLKARFLLSAVRKLAFALRSCAMAIACCRSRSALRVSSRVMVWDCWAVVVRRFCMLWERLDRVSVSRYAIYQLRILQSNV